MKRFYLSVSVLGLSVVTGTAMAQQQPDAGRTLQELNKGAPTLPAQGNVPVIEKPSTLKREHGGKQVSLTDVEIRGNSRIATPVLLRVVGDVHGKNLDMAGMKELADKVTSYYHAHDYPFAKAYVPAQALKGGKLEIVVVEGRYGRVKVDGKDRRAAAAQKFLAGLKTGDVIEGTRIERASLMLDDQPGYNFVPTIRPGTEPGTGDLTVKMTPDRKVGGSVGLDNHGNRYTGKVRGVADAYVNSPFLFGDRASISTIYTEEKMWYGSANYVAPLGYSGLRGNVGYAHTYYELGKEFASLDAHGTAKIASAGLSYPLIRSQQTNLTLGGTYQHKWLKDQQSVAGTDESKTSDVLPLALSFDNRDKVGGGGVTYGTLTWTHGMMDLDSSLRAADQTTAKTNGAFDKLNIDVARLQATPVNKLTVFGRAAGQMSKDNLDSSEDFGLGGPDGVRAYPVGESYGDEGWMAQVEARYAATDHVAPYAFYDYGSIKTNHKKWAGSGNNNSRQIGGAGVGVRGSYKGWTADASAAWRTNGGKVESDSRDDVPQLWVKVGYSF